tara:strand:- start:1947 stop:5324 length:3378 start_codon:yes stop_codon:yes gene_type:complete
MINNKGLITTLVLAVLSTIYLGSVWNDFFGTLNVNVSMDRQQAIKAASDASKQFDILDDSFEQASIYNFDDSLRNFVELKQGGKEKFQEIIDNDVYSPYNWIVRSYKEGEIIEAIFQFKPDGSPNGYRIKIPEDYDSDNLEEEDALALVEQNINNQWSGNFSDYNLIESSFKEMPNGRIDHSFLFEHNLQDIGEAKYRLRATVSGSIINSVSPFAFVPESFQREFANIRSDNDTIAIFANFAFLGIYLLSIGVTSLIIFYRNGWLRWKKSVLAAAFVAFFSNILLNLNFYPTFWMAYDTASSKSQFLTEQLLGMIANGILMFFILAASFITAESLTRKAFPKHIQIWKTWTSNVANSKRVLNDTIFAYLIVPIKLALVGAFYILMERNFGFWSPASSSFDPNYLASIFPWYTGLAISLQAGFWEEMLFRAVPIAAGVLIGQRYNMRFTGLMVAMVIQALIFGAGHANYPAQPSYARVVELFLPSIVVYGMIYLRLGVVFGAITHYVYDVVLFSLPIWYSSGYMFDKFMTVIGGLIPLLVILYFRIKHQKWSDVDSSSLNGGFLPTPPEKKALEQQEVVSTVSTASNVLNPKIIGIALLFVIGIFSNFKLSNVEVPVNSPSIDKEEAISIANQFLSDNNITLPDGYNAYAFDDSSYPASSFIWEELGQETYSSLLGSYVLGPRWKVRFAKFDGPVESRAREIMVSMDFNGNVLRFNNRFPEEEEGNQLSREEAQVLAENALAEYLGMNISAVTLTSAQESQKPNRLDWTFTFTDNNELDYEGAKLQNIISISGDQISGFTKFVFVPEEWKRMKRDREGLSGIIGTLFTVPGVIFVIGLLLMRSFKLLMDRKINVRKGLIFGSFAIFGILSIFNDSSFLNSMPTNQPIENLMTTYYISSIGGALIALGLINILLFGTLNKLVQPSINNINIKDAILGGVIVALTMIASIVLAGSFQLDLNPNFAIFNLTSYYPLYDTLNAYTFFGPIAFNIFFAALLNEITKGWSNNKNIFNVHKDYLRGNILAYILIVAVYTSDLGFQYNIVSSISIALLYGALIFAIFKFIIRNNYAMIPFYTLFMKFYDRFAATDFGAVSSYQNELIFMILSLILATFVMVYLTKKLFNMNVKG